MDTKRFFEDMNRQYGGITILQGLLNERYPPAKSVQMLVERGANSMARYPDGQTCFHGAISLDYAVDVLKALGATNFWVIDIDAKDNEGMTVDDLVRGATRTYTIKGRSVSAEKARKQLMVVIIGKLAPMTGNNQDHWPSALDRFFRPKKDRSSS